MIAFDVAPDRWNCLPLAEGTNASLNSLMLERQVFVVVEPDDPLTTHNPAGN